MLKVNFKGVAVASTFVVIALLLCLLGYNQLLLQKELNDQAKFDAGMLKFNTFVFSKLYPSPTPLATGSAKAVEPKKAVVKVK